MASKCIKSAGLNEEEIRIYDSMVAKFQADGLSAKDAQRKAAESRLEELNDDKSEIETKITEKLPEPAISKDIEVEEITNEEERQKILEEFAALSEVRRGGLQAEEKPYTTISGREADIGWSEATSILRNGKPALVHRGSGAELSTNDFEQDSLGKSTGHPTSGLGVYLSSDHGVASGYGSVVESVHLDIRNPKIYKVDDTPEFDSVESAFAHRQELQEQGFDGIIFDYRDIDGPVNFVAFDADQVIRPPKAEDVKTFYQGEKIPLIESPEFKNWFGDSKVVDENGDPLVVYHGTSAEDIGGDFAFDYSRIGEQGRAEGAGFYFTPNRNLAEGYGQLIQGYLAIQNPIKYDQQGFSGDELIELITRIAEIESKQTEMDIADGFLSNFGDASYEGLDSVIRNAADLLENDTAIDQLSGIVGAGVDIESVNRATQEVTGHDGFVSEGFSGMGGEKIYVAFFPEQVKSSIGNIGTFDPADPRIMYQGEFYSHVERTVEQSPQNKATGQQWSAVLKKTAGIKTEELTWLGVDEFLAGKKSVTKEELLDHIQLNKVEIEGVVKSDSGYTWSGNNLVDDLNRPVGQILDLNEGYVWSDKEGEETLLADAQNMQDAVREVEELIDDRTKGVESRPKFGDWQLPNGENYQELLLTLPAKQKELDQWQVLRPDGVSDGYWATKESAEARAEKIGGALGKHDPIDIDTGFRSGHYDELNILAHTRFNERTDVDGNKVLFLEEIQSDWHQAGRKKGYTRELTTEEQSEYDKLVSEKKAVFDKHGGAKAVIIGGKQPDAPAEIKDAFEKVTDLRVRINELSAIRGIREGGESTGAVPDAPLKKTWHETAFRRMVKYAAENGFDKIAWTTGEQQANRYDLSKQVDSIGWYANPDDTYNISYKKDGATSTAKNNVPENELSDLVGKDLSEKIVNASQDEVEGNFSGLDLKVGGEGMKGFYDKMLPSYAKKFGKKFGAKVETSEINISGGKPTDYADFNAYSEAKEKPAEVWSLPITESMIESVSQGVPLFQPTRASIQFTKTNESIIRLTKASDLSSFLHESGHLFLEMEKRFADKFGQTKEQQVLLDWLGVESFDEIEVEHHEKFAETFEVYLREGKAPSLKLREAFAAFSRWLTIIYRKITDSRLGRANLTPEIRQYMDRMLATEVEIEQAMANPAYDQLFRSAEQAGMTDDEWKSYQAQAAKAKSTATTDLNQKVIDELRKRKTKEWNEERSGLIEEEIKTLSEMPAYKALDLAKENPMNKQMVKDELGIKPGKTTKERFLAGSNIDLEKDSLLIAAAKKGGLNMAVWVREFVDPEYLKDRAFNNQVFGRPIFRKNKGMTADDLAEMSNELGYSVDATANDILDLVDRELSGDLVFTPEGIEAQAEAEYADYYGEEYEPEVTEKKAKSNLERLITRITEKDGVDPSEYAEVFGYSSVTAMINEMSEAGPIKRTAFKAAEAKMIEKYGDMLNDGRLELEAREAVHNDEQAKLLLMEIKGLSKGKSKINRDYLKAKAKDLIDGMTYKQMKPNKFYRAEIKAAQEAAVATTDETKLAAKTKQIANHYLYREATDAKERAQKMRKHIRSVEQRKYSANQVHPEYIRQLKLYTVASDFRANTKMTEQEAIEKLRQVANWANAQKDESIGLEIGLYDENLNNILEADKLGLLSEVKLKAWDEMTNEELSGIYMMTKHLRAIGGRMSDEVKMKRKAHFQSVADSILKNAVKQKRAPKGTKKRDIQDIRKSYAADVFLHADSVLRRLDGFKDNGKVYNAIKRPLDDAIANVQIPMQEEAGEIMDKIYHDHYSKSEIRKMNGQIDIEGHDLSLTKWEVMMMAANYGTESNRQALYDSVIEGDMPYTPELVSDALDQHMTENDWKFIQDMWAYTDTYKSRLFALERKRKGIAPPAVEGIPIQTKFGEIKGMYHPLSYDSADSWKVTEDEAEDLFKGVSMGHYAKAQTNDGMLKERVGSGGRPVNLTPSAWHTAINKNINLIALGEAVEEVQSVMASPDVHAAMLETGNLQYLKALDVWLKDTATGEVVSMDAVSRVARSIRTGFSVSAIGLNFGTILLQPLGVFQSMPIVGYGNMLKGVGKLIRHPMRVIEDIQRDNPFMRERGLTFNKDIRDTMNALHGNPNRPSFIPQAVQDSLFYGIIWTQRYVDAATWLAAHDKASKEFGPEATEDDYKHYANRAVARTQASGIWADRTPIERGTTSANIRNAEMVRMWTGLASYFFAKGNIAAELFTKTKFKDPVEAAKFTADMMVLFTAEIVIVAFMKNLWPDEDDDQTYAGYLAKETALSAVSTLPLLREVASYMAGFEGGTTTTTFYKAVADVEKQIEQGEIDMAAFKAINTLGGITFKYPSGSINRFVDAEYKRQAGKDIDPIDYLLWRKKD